jgi:periplasmic divalent cation tolerance protein
VADAEFIAVLITAPTKEEAESLAGMMVREKLAACCNILPGITSIYEWEGKLEKSGECLIIAKTRADLFDALSKAVSEAHSYEVPEIIAVPIADGYKPYIDWLLANTDD